MPPGLTHAALEESGRALLAMVRESIRGDVERLVIEAADVRAAILDEVGATDLLLIGASVPPGPAEVKGSPLGEISAALLDGARGSVIVVKTRGPIDIGAFAELASRPGTLAAADRAAHELRALPQRVDRWFGENNFHHAEFADLEHLVAAKESQGLTVSLVLPTLNEEATIGEIVRLARHHLMEEFSLVDELLVIDSASTDRTREIVAAEGVRVVQHPDVLSRYGSFVGKGEALWKSLYETTGDIVVWADTDVRDWHPRMVYGTVGPLIREPNIQYVKGYYQRPIVDGGVLKEGGGGRVTELVARPLINLLYPELSGFIQPLAGEYAGRRTLLETIPFFTSYAVEIGHLIDCYERVGLQGLGQVDLERRVHRNQEIEGLSKMSFVILQAVLKRLETGRKARLFAELGSRMKLPRSGQDELRLEVIELSDRERPPMIQIPEYAERARVVGAGAVQASLK
jgi:glucosyl-3-phosphoglycerate synthase